MPEASELALEDARKREAWRYRKCPVCGVNNFEFEAAIIGSVVMKESDPWDGRAYLIEASYAGPGSPCLRAAFLRGHRYLSPNWGLGEHPPDVALIFVENAVDEPLGLEGIFTVEGFEEQTFDETTLTPLQRQYLVFRDGGVRTVCGPDWEVVCTPTTTRADIAAAASIEYARLFEDVDGYDPKLLRTHRIIEGIEVDRTARIITVVMGS